MSVRRPIAVVSMAGLLPGSPDLEAFWQGVLAGRSEAGEIPDDRGPVPLSELRAAAPVPPGRLAGTRACLLDPFDLGPEAAALGVPDVDRLDPLVRLVLRVGAQAWAAAKTDRVDASRASIVLANIALPTETSSGLASGVLGRSLHERVAGARPAVGGDGDLGEDPRSRYVTALPAALLADGLGLGGGSYTLDAACASSLYALHLACEELHAGRADAVIAGGVNGSQALYTQLGFSQLRALSPTGVCSPFDRRADGLVVGEGAAMFVLKRLDDALDQGDDIAGVIHGVGLANDMRGSLLAPDSEGQVRAMEQAYAAAGWSPADVDLIECHGTGTAAGDGTELRSLAAVFGDSPAVIGSVKSNVGHLLTGAGAAGFAKVLLALRDGVLPPSAGFAPESAHPELTNTPFEVLTEPRPWADPGRPRRAAVSGFGFGGIDAHLLVEEWRGSPAQTASPAITSSTEPIAIVGMGARFGRLDGLGAFGRATLRGDPIFEPRPEQRWHGVEASGWFRRVAGDLADLPGAWIDRVDLPIGRFRIPPNEVPLTLPQQLLMLQVAAEALDDCSTDAVGDDAARQRTGVIVGLGLDLETTNFHVGWDLRGWARRQAELLDVDLDDGTERAWADGLEVAAGPLLDSARTLGALGSIAASRIAREWGLGGPSFAVSAEEASGLRSLEVAVRMLQRGEADVMLAGAVDLAGDVRAVLATDRLRPWSRAGRALPLDHRADGPLPGEGAAALVLKRLGDAERDGDRIYATVGGLASAGSWTDAITRAWSDAGADAGSAGWFELAAAGEPSADAAEVAALADALGASDRPARGVGAVRGAVGDAGAATGLASVVRAALALYHEVLPGSPGFERPGDPRPWRAARLHVPREAQPWLRDRAAGPRRAGVSAASLTGGCMHVALQGIERPADVDAARRDAPLGSRPAGLVVASAGDLPALAAFVRSRSDLPVEQIAAAWYRHHGGRGDRAFAATTAADLLKRIERPALLVPRLDGDLAWVFPGSGAHYIGQGRSLLAALPALARELDEGTGHLAGQLAADAFAPWRFDWSGDWEGDARRALDDQTRRVIFGQVAHGVTVGTALRTLGVRPDAIIGYSLGESAGLFASGGWTDRDGMYGRLLDSELFTHQLVGENTVARQVWGTDEADWVAAVLDRPAAEVREALTGTVQLLIVNAPGECVVGGARDEVMAVAAALGCTPPSPLEGVPTVHSDLVDPVADDYRALHVHPVFPPEGVRYYSGHLARSYDLTTDAAADSIVLNATRGLDFQATIEQAYADGVRVFVEGGPQGTCCRMIDRILGDRPHLAVPACQRGVDGLHALLRCLGKLVECGVEIDLEPLYGQDAGTWLGDPGRPDVPTTGVRLGGSPGEPPPVPVPDARPVPVPDAMPVPAPTPPPPRRDHLPTANLVAGALHAATATATAHGQYLAFAEQGQQIAADLAGVMSRLQAFAPIAPGSLPTAPTRVAPLPAAPAPAAPAAEARSVLMDRAACLEFAVGSIGAVLGPDFADADSYPTRVRLPDEPLMLVDRIVSVEGEPRSMTSGRTVTEHDVLPGAWYLDGGRAPVCISVEAGQADLFLSGYLGIDLQTKGERVYRLLDAEVEFHRGLPRVGETIRYDIHIHRFIRQGSTWLFFFSFEGYIGDEHLITMRDGCAGFFSDRQLSTGRGLVEPDPTEIPEPRPGSTRFSALVPVSPTTLDEAQVDALRTGDLEAAFGPAFAGRTLAPPLRLPGGRMNLVHRVTELDPAGGAYGRGRVVTEHDVRPDAWYLTCHFVDDMVMPGTLMYEGCLHTLRVLLLRLGWVVDEADPELVHYGPVVDEPSALKCRGQVIHTTKTLTYQLDLKEIGYDPEPYVLADAVMFADGRKVVRFLNVAYRCEGLDEATIAAGWSRAPGLPSEPPRAVAPVYTKEQLRAYCEGAPSECFGPAFARFDDGTRLARLPRDPFAFLDRVISIGYQPLAMKPSHDWTVTEWDVDPDAWFFAGGKTRSIPFAVLLEAALQPCGFISCAIGSPLHGDGLYYRNLGGKATLHFEPRTDVGTITARARLDAHSEAGGMMLQAFTMELHAEGRRLYSGTTQFGFFPPAAMADQVGLRGAFRWSPPGPSGPLPLEPAGATSPAEAAALGTPTSETLTVPAPVWTMLDRVDQYLPDGGPEGLGWLSGSLDVDPSAWFFAAHFFQDPVIPGSLGLESFLQLMQAFALERWPHLAETHRFEPIAVGREHGWQYRGQVIPTQRRVQVDAWIDAIEDGDEPVVTASGLLSVDGRDIYSMSRFGLRLVRS